MSQIPGENKKWLVSSESPLFGNVSRTRNMDFSKQGYASLARKAMALYSEDSDADFGRVVSIVADATKYYVVTTDHVFSTAPSITSLSFTELSATNMPTLGLVSDAVSFAGNLVVSGTTTVTDWNGSAWTSAARITGLSSSYPHPLCVFENRNELAVGNQNVVTTYNTSYALQNTLTLPSKYIVVSLRWRGNTLFIGTRTTTGESTKIFLWTGTGTAAQQGYDVGADWVYSMTEYRSTIVALTSAGQCVPFTGGGFDTVNPIFNLPIYFTKYAWNGDTGTTGVGKCLNRGMVSVGDILYFNIDGAQSSEAISALVEQPSGLWCFDPKVGPYHRAGYVTEVYKSIGISTLLSSIFTMSSAHGVETGDAVWAKTVTNISQLTAGRVYYAIKIDSTRLQLALSPSDAYSGRAITASGTISGDTLAFDTVASVGAVASCLPGAVSGFNSLRPNLFFASDVFFGGTTVDPDGNNIDALLSFGLGRNVGSFITAWIPTSGFLDSFQKILAKLKELNLDTDRIVIKYRTKDKFGLPTPTRDTTVGSATWVDTTSFTVNTTKKDIKSASVGDEVEITEGAGAGYSAHISAINDNSSTYTYTIDEEIEGGVSGDTSDIIVNNWKKLTPTYISNTTEDVSDTFFEQSLLDGVHGAQIQFKFELRGFDVAISLLDFVTAIHKEAK